MPFYFWLKPFDATRGVFTVGDGSRRSTVFSIVPAPQGALYVGIAPTDAGPLSVRLADGTVIDGNSYAIPEQIAPGEILWLVALPGSGTGATAVLGSTDMVGQFDWHPESAAGT